MTQTDEHLTVAPIVGPEDPRRFTDSGIEIARAVHRGGPARRSSTSASRASSPTRAGSTARCTASRPGRCASTPGYASAKESNERYRYLLSKGSTGLSMAFDLPTQLGLDSDNPRCLGEVGRTGVAIDTIDDMRTAFDGHPARPGVHLDDDQRPGRLPAAAVRARRRGAGRALRAAARHHPERRPQGVHRARQLHLPARAHDAADDRPVPVLPRAGAAAGTRSRSPATTSARRAARRCRRSRSRSPPGSPTCRPRSTRACRWTSSRRGWRSSSTATTTSSRRSPSSAPPGACGRTIMRERFGATNPKATMLRFHTQTGGVTLTAQQPENNIVRVALQGFAAVCGGTQSLHTNGFDEALALPTERAAKIALRTQQILAHESGATDTVDPFAGSYFVEALTDEIETRAQELIDKVDALGGLGQRDRVHHRRDRRVRLGLPGALPHRPGHRRRRQRVRGGRRRGPRPAARRPRVRARAGRSGSRRSRPPATTRSWSSAWRSCARSPAARRTCCPRSARR